MGCEFRASCRLDPQHWFRCGRNPLSSSPWATRKTGKVQRWQSTCCGGVRAASVRKKTGLQPPGTAVNRSRQICCREHPLAAKSVVVVRTVLIVIGTSIFVLHGRLIRQERASAWRSPDVVMSKGHRPAYLSSQKLRETSTKPSRPRLNDAEMHQRRLCRHDMSAEPASEKDGEQESQG